MRCKFFRMFLIALAPALLLQAADPQADAAAKATAEARAKAEAKAAEARAKAAAEAAAVTNGMAYADARNRFESCVTSNQLDNAAAAARSLLESAAKPGRGQWRNISQTYAYLTKALGEKKIFGRRHTMAIYEEAIAKLSENAKAEMLLQYAFYLDDLALADEVKVKTYVDQAFAVAALTPAQKIALCRRAAQRNNWAELDAYADKALAFAGNDLQMKASVWQWRLSANIRERPLDALCKAYDTFLADKTFQDHIHGSSGPFSDYVRELIRRRAFGRALDVLDKAPKELDDRTRQAYLGLRAELHRQAAARYYDTPDPEELKLAIKAYETIVAAIPTNRPREVIPFNISIAELAWQSGDTARAKTTAAATLKLIAKPENRESHQLLYILGRLAYEAEAYADATRIYEEAYGYIRGKPGNFPKRREMVEDLVRSACAIGDYAKAAGYADDLLELVRRHEKKRYQIYIDGLKARVKTP